MAKACRHFATHIGLLADQLGSVRLSADDAEHVTDAVHQVFDAAGLTIGLQRHIGEDQRALQSDSGRPRAVVLPWMLEAWNTKWIFTGVA